MSQWVVIVTGRELHEIERVFGPYRSQAKAEHLAEVLESPWSADYRDPEEYEIAVVRLSRAE